MSSVRVISGDGLIARDDRYLIWSADPALDILTCLRTAEDDGFKALGSMVLEYDFETAPFAVIDFDRSTGFVFGAVTLSTDNGILDGTTTSTWIEKSLESCTGLALNAEAGDPDIATDVIRGLVRGSGWVMSDYVPKQSAPTVPHEAETDNETKGESTEEAEIESLDPQSEVEEILGNGEALASEPDGPQVEVLLPPGNSTQVQYDEFETEPDLVEPVATERDANSVVVDLMEGNEAALADPFNGDVTMVASMINGPSTVSYDSQERDQADDIAEVLDGPPLRSPGKPQLRSRDADEDDLRPSFRNPSVRVRFDDGQEVELERGMYVGRHPTKNGLPVGYSSVTIRGEHVSRIHWELDLGGDLPIIRDLGSISGLTLQAEGLDPMDVSPDGEAALAGPVRVEFADRWAEIHIG